MIDAKQLRIGNWILDDSKRPSQVSADWFAAFDMDFNHATNNTFIPITPDILLKVGFVDYANNGWGMRLYLNASDELFWGIQERKVKYQTRGSGFTRDFNIQFVHQLQNLYFILTEMELD